ncbi:acyltransferase family protein [Pseudopelagicola sp. nBUS_19]|uniref:acyltransferase family protein n=1 Tax=Pseudopelagicola sp. nBUS_19 TaxID=3395316 RepID=UPI003EB967E7
MRQIAITPHRSEIDGLRAIAVFAVVSYHFDLLGASGGFVGVDIFFVISGFLIGGILWREKADTGRLALGNFYMRRVRRLAPAYIAMCVTVLAVGWLILLPFDYRETAKGIIAATVYLSNILFFRKSGYFDVAAEDTILLHTWSLSIEEQFYLGLPLVFLVFAKSPRAIKITLSLLLATSLATSIPFTYRDHTATFYLFPFRAWELLTGVLLAIWGIEKKIQWQFGQWMSWLGFALILASITLLQPSTTFPGWLVLAPVTGTVLLLLNGQNANMINQVLSLRPVVGIGLISYSLYLWHWPVLTLSKYVRGNYANTIETSFWITLSFVLAWLSWRFIEQPVRRGSSISGKAVFSGAAVATVALLSTSALVFRADGWVGRFGIETRVHINATQDFIQDFSRCSEPDTGPFQGIEICKIGPIGKEPTLLIWGDSHARAFYEGLAEAANENKRAAIVIWQAGCPPIFGIDKDENSATTVQNASCKQKNAQIEVAFRKINAIRDVLLIGRWTYYATGRGTGIDAHNRIKLQTSFDSDLNQKKLFSDALKTTVAKLALHDRHVFIARQPPVFPNYTAASVARALAHNQLTQRDAKKLGQINIMDATNQARPGLAALESSGAQIIDTWHWFCGQFLCEAVHNNLGRYYDNNHVTNSAALMMRHAFDPVFAGGTR